MFRWCTDSTALKSYSRYRHLLTPLRNIDAGAVAQVVERTAVLGVGIEAEDETDKSPCLYTASVTVWGGRAQPVSVDELTAGNSSDFCNSGSQLFHPGWLICLNCVASRNSFYRCTLGLYLFKMIGVGC